MKKTLIIISGIVILAVSVFGVYKFFAGKDQDMTVKKSSELYICPMHPQIQSDHPGVCPICHMDLVLKDIGNNQKEFDSLKNKSKESGDVILNHEQQVLANVQTDKVSIKEYRNNLTFNGYIKTGENNMRHISTPVSGKLIRMYVNYEGQMVTKGQAVFEMYSPEIYSTEKEYILALQNYEDRKSVV